MLLRGKHAVVTGGSRGIGAQTVVDLAKQGASVLLTYTSDKSSTLADQVIESVQTLKLDGVEVYKLQADSGSLDIGEVVKKKCLEIWAKDQGRVDIIVHNAGVGSQGPLEQFSVAEYDRIMNVNVRGVLLLTQSLLPQLPTGPKGRGGKIIVLSSVSARMGLKDQTIYAASKSAIEAAVKVWGKELFDRGITANCVNPGPVETDMFNSTSQEFQEKSRRQVPVAEPSEISDTIIWLASEKSRWVTGSVVSTNAGALPI